ncbi:hypothetical protein HK104_002769 [Borealophlyctis nickersoniae]|nr:hypothetical protein HK104_002769 [Borealophlyctis nickersoniae]
MEARKTHQRHMAGTAVGMLLQPSRGLRDDIVRRGGTPKDHTRENVQRLRELAKVQKAKKEERAKPPPAPFKMKQFEHVPAKLETRRKASSDGLASLDSTPESSRPSTASSRSSGGSESRKNFIQLNAAKAKAPTPQRTPKSPEVKEVGRKTRIGEIPKYLVDRKVQWAEQEKNRLLKLEDQKIPSGMMIMPENERLETLRFLQQSREEFMEELSKFPVIVELPSMKRRKAEIEKRLGEVEAAVDLFSRKIVMVNKDEYEQQQQLGAKEVGVVARAAAAAR